MLGEWVMNELRELDQVAYVRFASVYRSFQDVEGLPRRDRAAAKAEPTAGTAARPDVAAARDEEPPK